MTTEELDAAAQSLLAFLCGLHPSDDLARRRTWSLAVLRRASESLSEEIEDAAKLRQ